MPLVVAFAGLTGLFSLVLWTVGPAKTFLTLDRRLRIPAWLLSVATCIFGVAYMPHAGSINGPAQKVFIVLCGCVMALLFYVLKVQRQVLYGALEISAGSLGLVGAIFLRVEPEPLLLFLALATSIYVMVRGLGNVHDGLAKADAPAQLSENSPEVAPAPASTTNA